MGHNQEKIMSFASMHNDYLDPDIHLWKDYDESLPENPEGGGRRTP